MNYSKTIPIGDKGNLTLSESAGVAKISVSLKSSLGGGEAAGVVSGSACIEVDVSASELAGLFFGLIESKSPAGVVVFEEAAKTEILSLLAQT